MTQSWNRLLLLCAVVASSTASGQSPPPMSASLMRRVAEAVDGDQSGGPVFVVARSDSLQAVAGVSGNRDSALALAKRSGKAYAVFGPFQTATATRRVSGTNPMAVIHCEHTGLSNMYPPVEGQWQSGGKAGYAGKLNAICTDTMFRPPGRITGVSVTYEYTDGRKWVVPLRAGTDAVFLTHSALDKFVFPYYTKVLGFDAAATMRREMLGIDKR